MNFDIKAGLSGFPALLKRLLKNPSPMVLIAIGTILIAVLAASVVTGLPSNKKNTANLNQAKKSLGRISDVVQNFRRVLEDPQVQDLAANVVSGADNSVSLQQYVGGRIPDLVEINLFPTDLDKLRVEDLGPFGYVVLDMLFTASEQGYAPVQLHGKGEGSYLTTAVRVSDESSPVGYLLVKVKPQILVSAFNESLSEPGVLLLDQYNGRFRATVISPLAAPPLSTEYIIRIRVPSALFRIGLIHEPNTIGSLGVLRLMLLIVGLTLLGLGLMSKFHPGKAPVELREGPGTNRIVIPKRGPGK